jgi:tetratricopeptide (TPR) repeat protein
VDSRADLFALGLILREMLTGEPPDHAEPPPGRQGAGGPVAPVLRSLLAPRREDRCSSAKAAEDLLRDLREAGEPASTRHRGRKALLWGGAAVAAGLILLGYVWLRPPEGIALPPAGDHASSARDFHERGLQYLRERKETPASLEDAIKMFHRAVDAEPRFAAAWASLGEAYWIRYETLRDVASREEAASAVEESARLDPDLPEMHFARGRGLLALEEYEAARRELEKAVAGNPRYERIDKAWASLGAACQQLDDYSAGLRALQTAASLRPDDYRHRVALGLFYGHFSEYVASAEAYRQAVAQEPDSTKALINLASALLHLGRAREAADTLERSLRIEETPAGRSNLGNAWYFMKDYRKAAGNYRRATELEPGEAVHWANLGDALKVMGEPEARTAYLEAVRLSRQRVAEAPLDPTAHMRAGLYCARAGDQECALLEGRHAAQMQPRNAEILFRAAIIFCLSGRDQEALDYLEKAVRMGLSRAQIENDPDLTALRGHPRYRRILDLAG